jgi:hypothetical protein
MGTRLKGGRNKTVNHEKSSPKGMAISRTYFPENLKDRISMKIPRFFDFKFP